MLDVARYACTRAPRRPCARYALEHFTIDLSPICLLRRRLPASQKLAVGAMAALLFRASLVLTGADERHLNRETLQRLHLKSKPSIREKRRFAPGSMDAAPVGIP